MRITDIGNQTKPYIEYRAENRPEYAEPIHTWRTIIWAAKFKNGKYLPKDRYIMATHKLPGAEKRITEDCIKVMRKGRYHDWFFGKGRYEYL